MGFLIGLVVVLLIFGFVISVAAVAIATIIYVTVVGVCMLVGYVLLTLMTGDPAVGLLGGAVGLVGSVFVMGKLGESKPKPTSEPAAGAK